MSEASEPCGLFLPRSFSLRRVTLDRVDCVVCAPSAIDGPIVPIVPAASINVGVFVMIKYNVYRFASSAMQSKGVAPMRG